MNTATWGISLSSELSDPLFDAAAHFTIFSSFSLPLHAPFTHRAANRDVQCINQRLRRRYLRLLLQVNGWSIMIKSKRLSHDLAIIKIVFFFLFSFLPRRAAISECFLNCFANKWKFIARRQCAECEAYNMNSADTYCHPMKHFAILTAMPLCPLLSSIPRVTRFYRKPSTRHRAGVNDLSYSIWVHTLRCSTTITLLRYTYPKKKENFNGLRG